jgi:hypothetical protein
MTIIFEHLHKWFKAKRHSLNFDKTRFMQFTTTYNPQIELDFNCS